MIGSRVMKALPVSVAIAATVVPLLLFGALPLGLIVILAVRSDLRDVFQGGGITALENTILVSFATATFATMIGAPLAFALARLDLPRAKLKKTLLTLPAVLPPYLLGIAWIDLANPKTGLLNQLIGAPVLDVYTRGGIVWVLGLCFFPFVMLPIHGALERMDASLEESARIAGARPLKTLLTVTLPLATPTIASGAVLVFLATAATFGVPYLLGTAGTRRIELLTTAVVNHITVGGQASLGKAMSLSLVLLALSIAVAGLGSLATRGERRFAIVSGKGSRVRALRISPSAQRTVSAAIWIVIAIAVLLPIGTLLLVSILRAWGAGFGPSNWSLDNYRRVLFENRQTGPAIALSLILAIAAGSIAVILGAIVAYAKSRKPGIWTRALEALANAPYAVPGTVLALGLLMAWSREVRFILFERATFALDLFGGAWALLVAYAVKYLAFGVRLTGSALVAIDPALEEAARTAGAARVRAALDVVAPLLLPAFAAAWLLVFLPALSEITMSILLAGPGTQVVGTVLFELQSYADPPSAAVLATLLLALTIGGNEVLRRVTRGRGGF
jgi:iron(III) transport system permease protein